MSFIEDEYEQERRIRHSKRIEKMKRKKKIQILLRRLFSLAIIVTIAMAVITFLSGQLAHSSFPKEEVQDEVEANTDTVTQFEKIQKEDSDVQEDQEVLAEAAQEGEKVCFEAKVTQDTVAPSEEIISSNVILIDEQEQTILVQKASNTTICPASMTKILTILVAAEQVTDLDDTFTITLDITDYSFVHDCSNVGFLDGESVTVRDLFYGTILPSGADAAVGLATYVAGSQEDFVKLMNEKLEELGLSESAHFTNCVGLYDEEHYCTIYDMAVILAAALDNDLCKEILSAHTYTTSLTTEHPEGIIISNWFLRRIEDKDCGGTVLCGKTGYVVESGNCAASYAVDQDGKGYICVTADATSGWRCIYDHVALYKQFMEAGSELPS